MPQETLGYVEMEWTCRRCGTKNPGLTKTCQACGAQMDADQQFEKPAGQQLITDADKLAQAGRGADVHCPFCGTRNPAGAAACAQCGGDLTKAQKREAGQVVGAYAAGQRPASVKCPACAAVNAADAAHCQACGQPLGAAAEPARPAAPAPVAPAPPAKARANWVVAATGAVVALLCLCVGGLLVFQMFNTNDVAGVVQGVRWERAITVEAETPVERSDWEDEIPAQARVGTCAEKPRLMLDAPDPNRRSDKVCGTPYSIDQGDGTSKVVQDCQYQIYDNYCEYTARVWQEVDRAVATGTDLAPYWPDVQLAPGQREGARFEDYTVVFAANSQTFDYSVADETDLARFPPGSRWVLKVNGLGGLNSVTPAE